jgi:hypothetical protein
MPRRKVSLRCELDGCLVRLRFADHGEILD